MEGGGKGVKLVVFIFSKCSNDDNDGVKKHAV